MQTQTQRFLQGEVVDGKYQVGKYLGGSDHSVVFVTQYGELHPKEAAIKLMPARPGAMEAQLSRWRLAANFSHPHLLQTLDMGRCEVGHTPMLYVVTELASENLSQIVPERALTQDEAREMLTQVVDVLGFIHSRGFVHGHLKPSNVMAIGEELKLSADGICRLGETIEAGMRGLYDPPEGSRNGASTAGDIWSLGMTLVEVLTQRLPEWTPSDRRDPVLPETIPPAFDEVAHHCLRRDPKNRWSAVEVAAHLPRLTPAPVAPVPIARQAPGVPGYAIAAVVLAVVVTAIFVGSKVVRRHPAEQTQQKVASGISTQPEEKPSLAPPDRAASVPQSLAPPVKEQVSAPPAQPRPAPARTPASPAAQPASRAPTDAKPISAAGTMPMPDSPAAESPRGQVLRQVVPDVPKEASDTVWGTVRVGVKVSVDALGKVTEAELDSAGPSRYFAALSLGAARQWEFAPPRANGAPVASTWILHFNYTNRRTTIVPLQTQP